MWFEANGMVPGVCGGGNMRLVGVITDDVVVGSVGLIDFRPAHMISKTNI